MINFTIQRLIVDQTRIYLRICTIERVLVLMMGGGGSASLTPPPTFTVTWSRKMIGKNLAGVR